MDLRNERWNGCRRRAGSALILTVVLTSLLAIVGVLFLMAARIDKMATSATADNRQLGFAVDTVVAQIADVLAKDVPGASPAQEYYDYPDANNPWLADLEPYALPSTARSTSTRKEYDYFWRQISNITGRSIGATTGVHALTVGEREPIRLNPDHANADADGDGVGDAMWFEVLGLSSNKGKPIYVAVRIVDNGGMLNVNTGHRFDPTDPNRFEIDGHSQLHVNVLALAVPPGARPMPANDAALWKSRAVGAVGLRAFTEYEREVTWQYEAPSLRYTPFDVSDELELRYRYLLNHTDVDTRVENWGWFRAGPVISTPVDSDGNDLDFWYIRTTGVDPCKPVDPNTFVFDPKFAYRHIATAYNLDRILTPLSLPVIRPGMDPRKMINVNATDEELLTQAVVMALGGQSPVDPAQIVANIREYIDEDDAVTPLGGTLTTSPYHGFERPGIYLSELAYKFVRNSSTGEVHKSYAIELCKPYFEDNDPLQGEWQLRLGGSVTQMITWSGTRQFHVLLFEDSQAPLQTGYVSFKDLPAPPNAASLPGYNPAKYSNPSTQTLDSAGFKEDTVIELRRKAIWNGRDDWFTVDLKKVPATFMEDPNGEKGTVHRLQRDITPEHCILRLWGAPPSPTASLGNAEENFVSTDPRKLQAHPANQPLTNIGELGQIFAENAYGMPDPDASAPPATSFLIDVANPVFRNLFNYLTVVDPTNRNSSLGQSEMRVKGRVNINTAPAFVLAQLPWMQYRYDRTRQVAENTFGRALEIVAYRDLNGAFESIAGLMQVPRMRELQDDLINNLHDVTPPAARGPDLTFDTVTDDTEERDLIFTRISNLVTVRSDVFTAYILVRIGLDGPQKRVVAILDRGETTSATGPVRVISLEQVPDPR